MIIETHPRLYLARERIFILVHYYPLYVAKECSLRSEECIKEPPEKWFPVI
jgi:hypothetical protein